MGEARARVLTNQERQVRMKNCRKEKARGLGLLTSVGDKRGAHGSLIEIGARSADQDVLWV